MKKIETLGAIFVSLGLFLFLLFALNRLIPFNAQEFSQARRFFCQIHPLNEKYEKECQALDLKLPGVSSYLPLRSGDFSGNFYFTYYPFHFAIQSPIAHRIFGFCNFLLIALLSAYFFRMKFGTIFFGMLMFPFLFFSIVLDTGADGLILQIFLLSALVLRQAYQRKSLSLALAASLLVTFGFLQNQVFLWLVFPLLIVSDNHGFSVRRSIISFFFGVLAISLVTYYELSQTRSGAWLFLSNLKSIFGGEVKTFVGSQIDYLVNNNFSKPDVFAALKTLFFLKATLVKNRFLELLNLAFDFSKIAPLHVALPSSVVTLYLKILLVGISIYGLIRRNTRSLVLCFFITLVLIALFGETSLHHFVLALFFMGIVASKILENHTMKLILIPLLLVTWGFVFYHLPKASLPLGSEISLDPHKDQIIPYLRENGLEDRVVQFHDSPGLYEMALAFGSKNSLILYEPKEHENAPTEEKVFLYLTRVAAATKRNILLVTSSRDVIIHSNFTARLGKPVSKRTFGTWTVLEFQMHRR